MMRLYANWRIDIREVSLQRIRASSRRGASAPHFAEHHITLPFLPSHPSLSVRLHRTPPTSIYVPLRTRAYNFHRARWRDVSRRGKTRGNASTCDTRACHQSKTAPAKSMFRNTLYCQYSLRRQPGGRCIRRSSGKMYKQLATVARGRIPDMTEGDGMMGRRSPLKQLSGAAISHLQSHARNISSGGCSCVARGFTTL